MAFLATIIVGLSTLTNAAKNPSDLVSSKEKRGKINGAWKAEVTYDWQNAKYTETFMFEGEEEKLVGTASFLGLDSGVAEGKTAKDKIEFVAETQEIEGDGNQRQVVHRYQGKLVGDEIKFVMQTEGGYSEHVAVEFIAKKLLAN